MKTVAIINQKGGCGKTTSAINLAGCFAAAGWRTLLVDMDPQSHCAAGLAIPEQRIDLTIGEAMLAAEEDGPDAKGWIDPTRLLWRVSRNLDLAPSTMKLAALEASRGELAGKPDAERRLGRALARLATHGAGYDVCFVDCSPAFGLLAYNALAAADEIIIPVETGFFSLQGSAKQVSTIKSLAKRLGVTPNHRLLATMHDPTSVLAKDLLDELHRRFAGRVIPQVIRYDQSLREAASFGQPVGEYAPESIGARDYEALAAWLMERGFGQPTGEPTRQMRPTSVPDEPTTTVAALEAETLSPVQVVAGIAERTLDAARPEPAQPSSPPPEPTAEAAVPVQVATEPAAPQPSRAADMAQRARKMQSRTIKEREITPVAVGPIADNPAAEIAQVTEETTVAVSAPAAPEIEFKPWAPDSMPAPTPVASTSGPVLRTMPITRPGDPELGITPAFRALGVHQNEDGVWFVQPASAGSVLSVAGDFNGWSAEASPMRLNRELGVFEVCLPLRPGPVQYRLVVDGDWIADRYNPLVATNPYGEANSVVVVRERRARGTAPERW